MVLGASGFFCSPPPPPSFLLLFFPASYFDIYKSQNEQSKINVHISYVENPAHISFSERGWGNHHQRDTVLRFCSTALQLLKS